MELGESLEELSEYGKKKASMAGKNNIVKRPIPKIAKDVLPSIGKSKRKYTPTKMRNGINRYFKWCEAEDEIPSVSGLVIHLGIYRKTFYNYMNYPEFTDMIEHARLIIKDWAEADVYATKGMAAGKIAYMKNVHSWSDKLESSNYSEVKVISVDEARSKIEALAPKLLELLHSETVVDQITDGKESKNPKRKV